MMYVEFGTLGSLIAAIEKLGVRAKVRVFQQSGLVVIRVSSDVEKLFAEWVEPRRLVGIQVLVLGDLRWWECWWSRVQV